MKYFTANSLQIIEAVTFAFITTRSGSFFRSKNCCHRRRLPLKLHISSCEPFLITHLLSTWKANEINQTELDIILEIICKQLFKGLNCVCSVSVLLCHYSDWGQSLNALCFYLQVCLCGIEVERHSISLSNQMFWCHRRCRMLPKPEELSTNVENEKTCCPWTDVGLMGTLDLFKHSCKILPDTWN